MKEMVVCPVGIGEYLTVLLDSFFYNNALTHCKKKKKKIHMDHPFSAPNHISTVYSHLD